jgi:Zn ribbon nucleic-acid-binding protein
MVTEKEIEEWLFLDMLEKKIRDKKEVLSKKLRDHAAQEIWKSGDYKKRICLQSKSGMITTSFNGSFKALEDVNKLRQLIPDITKYVRTVISIDLNELSPTGKQCVTECLAKIGHYNPAVSYKSTVTYSIMRKIFEMSQSHIDVDRYRTYVGNYQVSLTGKPRSLLTGVQCPNCNIPTTIVEHKERKLYHCVACDWAEPFDHKDVFNC